MIAALLWVPVIACGCLSERSIEMTPEECCVVALASDSAAPPSTRQWLEAIHQRLRDQLPSSDKAALLTGDLTTAEGEPVDVFSHFGVNPDARQTLLGNFDGLICTAQGASQSSYIDQPPPSWPGFEDVWIPINEELSLSGRIGFATENGTRRQAACIVIMPGLFGDNGVKRSEDLATFLLASGYHVLGLEIRGYGQTERRYPGACMTFGVTETVDLMQVSDWLTAQPGVTETGLIGFCWSANIALLAAWYENRGPQEPDLTPGVDAYLPELPDRRRFTAGVMAFSPVLTWEELVRDLDVAHSELTKPVYAAVQETVRGRAERKGMDNANGSLRDLIQFEYDLCDLGLPHGVSEGYRFLNLVPPPGRPASRKFERVRTPVLIVHGANDPLAPAQDVADFMAPLNNPMVAAVVLPSGGHVGFAAYAKTYYCSLVANFFDPVVGAAAFVSGEGIACPGESKPEPPSARDKPMMARLGS